MLFTLLHVYLCIYPIDKLSTLLYQIVQLCIPTQARKLNYLHITFNRIHLLVYIHWYHNMITSKYKFIIPNCIWVMGVSHQRCTTLTSISIINSMAKSAILWDI